MFRFQSTYAVVSREWKNLASFRSRVDIARIASTQYVQQSAATTAIRSFHRTTARAQPVLRDLHDTEIVCIWNNGTVCMMGDDMITQGPLIVERLRKILPKNHKAKGGTVIGFAGTTDAALSLLKRLEEQLAQHSGRLDKSCVTLARRWRTDKDLRYLHAAIIVADKSLTLDVNVKGDLVEQYDGIIGVGRGPYAIAVAKVLMDSPELSDVDIDVARKSMDVATDLCVHPQHDFRFGFLDSMEEREMVEKTEVVPPLPPTTEAVAELEEKKKHVKVKSFAYIMKEEEEKRKKGLSEAVKRTVAEHVKQHKQDEEDVKKNLTEILRSVGVFAVGSAAAMYYFFFR
ncbi:hypothetical protein ACA910_008871 [Epithemia clementina (nom. ined.)]